MTLAYADGRTRSVDVSMWVGGSFRHSGTLCFNRTLRTGHFEYLPSWTGPAVDPVNLNYQEAGGRRFTVDADACPGLLHRVFEGALPGVWGMRVLEAEVPGLSGLLAAERLHWFGSRTVGALSFHVNPAGDERPANGLALLEAIRRRAVKLHLGQIDRFGSLSSPDGEGPAERMVLEGLSAFGGVRPKCLYEDRTGGQWLAKFNVGTDPYNMAKVEHALAVMSAACGIRTVETQVHAITEGNEILFVRRFDREGAKRFHKVSAYALLDPRLVPHHNQGDYSMIFALLEGISCNAQEEKRELMRRMLFNVAVSNADAHMMNTEFIFDPFAGCYRLSPAFDVTVEPFPYAHAAAVFGERKPDLEAECMSRICSGLARFGINAAEAHKARDQIVGVVAQWQSHFEAAGVAESETRKIKRALRRTEQLALSLADARAGWALVARERLQIEHRPPSAP